MNANPTESQPTMISCPACSGVLRAQTGPGDHLEFVCSVGHAFSLEDVYRAKEEQVEQAQWSLIAFLKHVQMIGGLLLESDRKGGWYRHEDVHRRLNQVTGHIAVMERMVHETQWPPSSSRPGALDERI